VFDLSVPLAARFDAVEEIPPYLLKPCQGLLELHLAPDVRGAVVRLLDRSTPGLLRRVARRASRLAGRGGGEG
jgi:hypothetical protein